MEQKNCFDNKDQYNQYSEKNVLLEVNHLQYHDQNSMKTIGQQNFTTQNDVLVNESEGNQNASTISRRKLDKWSPDELNSFKKLYFENGSNWTQIARNFKSRSVHDLKNWFSNSLRKALRKIEQYRWKMSGETTQKFRNSYVLSLLRIIQQTERVIKQMYLTINQNSILMTFKYLIIELIFNQEFVDYPLIDKIIKLSNILGKKLKCMRVFKMKKRNLWKLTISSLQNILSFDRVILEGEQQIVKVKLEEQIKAEQLFGNYNACL